MSSVGKVCFYVISGVLTILLLISIVSLISII